MFMCAQRRLNQHEHAAQQICSYRSGGEAADPSIKDAGLQAIS
jgi:hypothetical protein